METWTCIIIDDEEHALAQLEHIVQKIPGLQLVGAFQEAAAALAFLRQEKMCSIIFSDIDMPYLNGIEAAQLLRPYCKHLLFTTAHSKYALEAFEVNADGYLLKPLFLSDVLKKVEFLRQRKQTEVLSELAEPLPDHLFVKGGSKNTFLKVAYRDIVCIDAGDHYLTLLTPTSKVVFYLTMKEIERHLIPRPEFVRISKSCLISLDYLLRTDGNRVYLQHTQEQVRDVGETYRKAFFEMLSKCTLSPSKK